MSVDQFKVCLLEQLRKVGTVSKLIQVNVMNTQADKCQNKYHITFKSINIIYYRKKRVTKM